MALTPADAHIPPSPGGSDSGRPFGIAVLASGTGSNLQAILDQLHGDGEIEVLGVGSNRSDARALGRARAIGIPTAVFERADYDDRPARDLALADWLEDLGVRLVVLAGYMELLSAPFIERFAGRIVNVHPSLLPSFPGLRAIEQALDHGVQVTGVTVHLVDEGVDTGPVLLQQAVEVPYTRDLGALEERIHAVEHELLPQAIRLLARREAKAGEGHRFS